MLLFLSMAYFSYTLSGSQTRNIPQALYKIFHYAV